MTRKMGGLLTWLLLVSVIGVSGWEAWAARHYSAGAVLQPTQSGAASQEVKVGSLAPDFALVGDDGHVYRLSALRGRKVVLYFLCGCPRCVTLGRKWELLGRFTPDVVVLGISTMAPSSLGAFRRSSGVSFPVLFDPAFVLAQQYGAMECPRSWIISETGRAIYASRASPAPLLSAQDLMYRLSAGGRGPQPRRK